MKNLDLRLERVHLPDLGVARVRRPEADPVAAILLLPPIAGVDDYVTQRAGHLAAEGYLVGIVDYFARSGSVPELSTPAQIGAAVGAMDDAQVLRDCAAALAWLARQGNVRSVGVLGYCIGGSYAALSACREGGLACAVSYYGQLRNGQASANRPRDPISVASGLRVPLLMHVGEADRLISAGDIAAYREAATGADPRPEVHSYPGAPHAFDEWHRPSAFRPVPAAEAWQRTLGFLDWHLRHTLPGAALPQPR